MGNARSDLHTAKGEAMAIEISEERVDFNEWAARAEQRAETAEFSSLAALWRELAATYRELGLIRSRRAAVLTPSADKP